MNTLTRAKKKLVVSKFR